MQLRLLRTLVLALLSRPVCSAHARRRPICTLTSRVSPSPRLRSAALPTRSSDRWRRSHRAPTRLARCGLPPRLSTERTADNSQRCRHLVAAVIVFVLALVAIAARQPIQEANQCLQAN
jgi:hypothetical protein